MARSIGATLTLNSGNFYTNMKSAISASNNLRNTLNGATSGMKQFGNQSNATGSVITSLASKAAVAVGAFVGIRQAVNFGKDVVNTGLEFEQGMANVSAISGATGAELTALSEKAKEMGATTKFSAIEASEAMTYMGMAGLELGSDDRRHIGYYEPCGGVRRRAWFCFRYCDRQLDRFRFKGERQRRLR